MVKYLLGVLSGIVVVVFFGLFLIFVFWAAGSAVPALEQDSVLTINFSGDIPEHIDTEFSLAFLGHKRPITLLELRDLLETAAEDDRIRGLALRFSGLAVGWGKAQELRWAIEEFRRSGKPVYAHIEVGGTLDYFVGSAADQLFLAPEGFLDVKGLRAEVSFYKETLDKLGVVVEMEHIGKYKSAVEPYSRTSMSDAFREVTNALLDDVFDMFLEGSAEARPFSADEFRALIDTGPFVPRQALEAKLVDALLYEDEFYDKLQEALELEEMKRVSLARYRDAVADPFDLGDGRRIAVVYGIGTIVRGKSETDPLFGTRVLGSESFAKTLREVREDDGIEAVIIRINSPGGDSIASDRMWRALNLLVEKKPVVISMSNVAASGGYYMAMASGVPVVAYPGTYTGSIGVFFGKANLGGLYKKIGLTKEILTRGRFAAIDTDYRGLNEAERAKLRELIEGVYHSFVAKVAEARGREWDEIHEVAQGRVWLGVQAERAGLVDELGGWGRAIELAKQAAGIGEEEEVSLIAYPAPKQFLQTLLDGSGFGVRSPLPELIRDKLGAAAPWPALLRGGALSLLPYVITIR